LRLFNLAAERGNPRAFANLANAYHLGQGVAADPVTAYMWVEIAGGSGESVSAARKKLAAELTPSEIQEAVRRAVAWRSLHSDVLHTQRSQFFHDKTSP
jgi:TPR repeat protein